MIKTVIISAKNVINIAPNSIIVTESDSFYKLERRDVTYKLGDYSPEAADNYIS